LISLIKYRLNKGANMAVSRKDLLSAMQQIIDSEGEDLENNTKVYNPDVVREGDKLIIPDDADLGDVIKSLERKHKAEQQNMVIHDSIPVPPWDGAISLVRAIESELGVVTQETNWWEGGAPAIEVEVDYGKTMTVPWGTFILPAMEGATIGTGVNFENNRMIFMMTIKVKRKYEKRIRKLLAVVRKLALTESLHKGKAFSIAFTDSNGRTEELPKPRFFQMTEDTPIFNKNLELKIARNIFVPLQQTANLKKIKEPLKRGALFAGAYGTGKTMLAHYIAREAIKHGWTFIYVKNSAELPSALTYAECYQPVVVFAEDIDRIAGTVRDNGVNELLNQLDGIDSKVAQIMTILTTNHPESVNAAMRRPGRIDTILEITTPDPEAVERMIVSFARGLLDPNADVSEAAKILAGDIPARIKETVGRAKLEALRRTSDPEALINGEDLAFVAAEVKDEAEFFNRQQAPKNGKDIKAIALGFEALSDTLSDHAVN
jgi:transitional endoplasmic reticulum ATPase